MAFSVVLAFEHTVAYVYRYLFLFQPAHFALEPVPGTPKILACPAERARPVTTWTITERARVG